MFADRSLHAVIMGDLVDSEAATSTADLHATFNLVVDSTNHRHEQALCSPLTITLGDEFQGLANSFAAAADIVRRMRFDFLLRGVECRFTLGLAHLETPLNRDRAWNMMGPGLAQTRAKLNEKHRGRRYLFSFPGHDPIEGMLDALGAGLAAIERRWTAQQLHDIAASVSGLSVSDIARSRDVSAHSVYKVRASGEFDLYRLQWAGVMDAMDYLDRAYGEQR